MRNILLALLLANILYFMWGSFVEPDEDNGIAVVSRTDLGPQLKISTPLVESAKEGLEALLSSSGGSALAVMAGRSCITVGPFRAVTDADGALAEFEASGLPATLRTTQAPVFMGHWVQVRDVPNRDAGNEMLERLKGAGLDEAYMVRTDDEGLKISIGLFGEVERAERVELEAKSLGLNVDVTPRTKDATVTFVDVGLPPGRGAGSIIQQYGEDRVLLRDAAKCPRGS